MSTMLTKKNVMPKKRAGIKQILLMPLLCLPIPAFSIPDLTPGSSSGAVSISATGAAEYSMPLVIPPGIGGLTPSLALQYSSYGDNGLLGTGWSINGLYSIGRCPQTLAQDENRTGLSATAADRFCLNGKRLILVSGNYGENGAEYRTELDEFSRIVSYTTVAARGPDSFKVWTKDGRLIELGATTDSKLLATQTVSTVNGFGPYGHVNTVSLTANQVVLQWNANKVSDQANNYYTITYTKTDLTGEIYPDRITYTSNPGQTVLPPSNVVYFLYETRPTLTDSDGLLVSDYPVQYQAGSRISPKKRLKSIEMWAAYAEIWAPSSLVRSYTFAYSDPEIWGSMRAELASITECGFSKSATGICMAPVKFEMSKAGRCIYDSYSSIPAYGNVISIGNYTPLAADFDGDGRTDIVSIYISSEGIKLLESRSTTTTPSGTDFVPPKPDTETEAYCKTAVKPGVGFSSATQQIINAADYSMHMGDAYSTGDVDGDGIPEIVTIPQSINSISFDPIVLKRQANGTYAVVTGSASDNSNFTSTISYLYGRSRAWLADVDGDGKLDAVTIKYIGKTATNTNIAVFWRKGLGNGTFAQTVRNDYQIDLNESPLLFNTFMGDVNGDGKADLVFAYLKGGYILSQSLTGTGSSSTAFNAPVTSSLIRQLNFDNALADNTTASINLIDVNRDGLSDLVLFKVLSGSNKAAVLTALAKGDGAFASVDGESAQLTPSGIVSSSNVDVSTLPWRTNFTDIDGDGRPDLVVTQVLPDGNMSSKQRLLTYIFANRGDGRFTLSAANWSTNQNESSLYDEFYWSRLSGDFDGDGLGDIVSVHTSNTRSFVIYPLFPAGPVPALLTKVTDGNGAVTKLLHVPLTHTDVYTKTAAVFPKIALRAPLYVVKTLQKDSGNELASPIWSYTYSGAVADVTGRGFLGFSQRKVTDPLGIITTSNYSQDFPYIGMETSTTTTKDGVTLSSIENTLAQKAIVQPSGKTTYFPYAGQTVSKAYEVSAAGALVSQTTTTNTFDDWGNLLSATAVTTGDGNTYTRISSNSYYPNTISATSWRVGEVSQSAERRIGPLPDGGTSDITRTTGYSYGSNGLLSKVEIEPANAALKVTKELTRDFCGSISQIKTSGSGIEDRIETFTTSTATTCYQAPIKKFNALGHETRHQYDAASGLQTNITQLVLDQPSESVSIGFDDLGRVGSRLKYGGPFEVAIYKGCDSTCKADKGESYLVVKDLRSMINSVRTAETTTYFDRNDRERRTVAKAMDGRDIVVETEYDALGRISRVSRPYFAGSNTIQWTTRSYDAVGRLSTESVPGSGQTTYAYELRKTIATNPKAQVKKQTSDALGRLIATTDAAMSVQVFAYDAFDNVVRSTDVKGNIITNQFDLLGRKTQQQDPDMGTWNYQYDVLGQLVWQHDANNKITTYTYDKLGRPLTRSEADLNSTWTWDLTTNGIYGIGHLGKLQGDNGFERNYTYNQAGQLVSVVTSKAIDPNALPTDSDFTFQLVYDDFGRLDTLTYPTGVGYRNLYDSYGYLSAVVDKDTSTPFWQALSRDEAGNVTREKAGNGLVTDRKYKSDSGRIDTIQTGTLSGNLLTASVQNDAYSFDAIGNLAMRSQYFGSTSINESFDYDNLNRMTSSTLLGGAAKTVAYDEIGNITYRSDVGAYSYGCGGPHRLCGVGFSGSGNSHDDNGNVRALSGYDITWTSYNYPRKITKGTNAESFLYTPERERIRKISSVDGQDTATTVYLNPRIDMGGTFEKTYNADGSVDYTHFLYAGNHVIGSIGLPPATAPAYTQDFSVQTTTSNSAQTGVVMPSSDPQGLITWENPSSNGRLLLKNKAVFGSFQSLVQGAARYAIGDTHVFRAEVTLSATASAGRSVMFKVVNGSTTNGPSYGLYVMGSSVYVGYRSVNSNDIDETALLGSFASGLPYVLEIVTGPTTSRLRFYPKDVPTIVYTDQRGIAWGTGGSGGKYWVASVNGGSSLSNETAALDNLSMREAKLGAVSYFHTDHLGSITAVTNDLGTVVERLSYDAWGKRRNPDSSEAMCSAITGQSTTRGFTTHEHLDSVDIIHMNGRIYSPQLGRFLSADPNVFYPEDMQDFNRYSYVHNGPLSFIDPDGFNGGVGPDGTSYTNVNAPLFTNIYGNSDLLRATYTSGGIDLTSQLQANTNNYAITTVTRQPGLQVSNQHSGTGTSIGVSSSREDSKPAPGPAAGPLINEAKYYNDRISAFGDASALMVLPALDKFGGLRNGINKRLYDFRKATGKVLPNIRITKGKITKAGNYFKTLGKFTFVVGAASAIISIDDGLNTNDDLKVAGGALDLGIGFVGVTGGLYGAVGSATYGATGLLLKWDPAEDFLVGNTTSVACTITMGCDNEPKNRIFVESTTSMMCAVMGSCK